MRTAIRVLFVADTHLGFDLPVSSRIARRRRGHDFLANYAKSLEPALAGDVDVVVHGGDVFHRPRVPSSLGYQAFEPLVRVAESGIPVFIVAGNHERSRLPHSRFAKHRGIHIFDRPRTYVTEVRGVRVAIAGFPSERRDIRTRFADVLHSTGWAAEPASARLLCMHQCVEGATVGPADYMFTTASDVIRAREIPASFAAVLSGHIHRHQVLTTDLVGRRLGAPVLYPGSIERTSLAENGESKGYLIVDVEENDSGGSASWQFCELPARPMVVNELGIGAMDSTALDRAVRRLIADAPLDAVLRIRVSGDLTDDARRLLSMKRLRAIAPSTMNIEVRSADRSGFKQWSLNRTRRSQPELELPFAQS